MNIAVCDVLMLITRFTTYFTSVQASTPPTLEAKFAQVRLPQKLHVREDTAPLNEPPFSFFLLLGSGISFIFGISFFSSFLFRFAVPFRAPCSSLRTPPSPPPPPAPFPPRLPSARAQIAPRSVESKTVPLRVCWLRVLRVAAAPLCAMAVLRSRLGSARFPLALLCR